jgi:hypothetical protein
MKNSTTTDRPLQKAVEALSDLITEGTRLGLDALDSIGRMPMPELGDVLRRFASATGRVSSCGCHIPPPCWMPQSLGELTSHVCPGGTATLRIRITNRSATSRTIVLEATGPASGVTITPGTLTLGPMEHGVAVASLAVPATADCGEAHVTTIWVRGCQDHYLCWKVKVAERGVDVCHQIHVEDGPDFIHHWYDHFYCERPCRHGTGANR